MATSDERQRATPSGGEAVDCGGSAELTADAISGLRPSHEHQVEGILERPGYFHDVVEPEGDGVELGETYRSAARRAEAGPGTSPVELTTLQQTPPPVASWQASGGLSALAGFPSDAQVAVSTTHAVVTARAVIAFYNKAGQPLRSPIGTEDFFGALNLQQQFGINYFFDTRTIFDAYRRRFWVAALGRNTANTNETTKFAVGVSRSENPLDGWYLCWWNAVAGPVFQAGDSADYPVLGIDGSNFYQTNAVSNSQSFRYWRVLFVPADAMASGVPGSSLRGWQYWDLTNPDGSKAGLIQPAVHHGASPRTYFVSRFGSNELLIWALTNALQSSQQLTRAEVTVSPFIPPRAAPQQGSSKPIEMRNLGTDVLKAIYRNNMLFLTAHDARDWDNRGEILTSIRLVRLNVANYPSIPTTEVSGFIDRPFGARNDLDDPPGAYFYYGWPAVEVNRYGDMVVVYTRSGSSVFPEVRFSVHYATEPDIRPSRLLKAGEAPYAVTYPGYNPEAWPWGDLAGASVDPSDDTTIWVAQQYAAARTPTTSNNGNFDVWVGAVSLATVLVPDCTDLMLSEAQALIESAGLILGTVTTLPPEPPPGRLGRPVVVSQSPQPGTDVNRGVRVNLEVQRQRIDIKPRSG